MNYALVLLLLLPLAGEGAPERSEGADEGQRVLPHSLTLTRNAFIGKSLGGEPEFLSWLFTQRRIR